MAQNLGIGNQQNLGKYYPLAIGAYEQTLLDMTSAYAGIANRGVYIKPTPFEKIIGPNKAILWDHKNNLKSKQVVSEEVADTMNWMLRRVVKDGTGIAASMKGREVAGKTGTSEGGRDLWFIGSIPQLSSGVWFGYDNNQKTKGSSGDAAYAWKSFMEKVTIQMEILEFPKKQ